MFLDNIKDEIRKHSVISFDIFDTLLLRPYVKPTDLFLHIEKSEKIPFFCYLRQDAEKNARMHHKELEDISLDMIYDEIDEKYKHLKQTEMDWEEMVLRANPEIKHVYEYAQKQGKKIVIASDMYLPTDFIRKILHKNGYKNWNKLYVSAELGKTKCSGHMYQQIIEDFSNIKPKDILHIGDNKHSDFKKAKRMGIEAIHYPMLIKQYLKQDKRAYSLLNQKNNALSVSVLLGLLAYQWQQIRCDIKPKNDYWSNIGYNYAGPLSYGYARFIEKEALKNDLDNIFFIARDGWLLQKVFKSFNNRIKNSYVYAPRILNLICRLDYNRKDKHQAKAIIDNFSKTNDKIKKLAEESILENNEQIHTFIQKYIDLFKTEANRFFDNYKKYLTTKTSEADKIGLVDTITCEFSSQKLIQSSLKNTLKGIYWGILTSPIQGMFETTTFTKSEATTQTNREVFTANWNFIEFLITSPEYPIKNISSDGKPIYDKNPSENEILRSTIYPKIADSAIDFANEVNAFFHGKDIFFDASDLITWINLFVDYPTSQDIRQMSKINHPIDSNHSVFVPLFCCRISFKDFISQPKKMLKVIKKSLWKTKKQAFLINLLHPISFHMRGLKKIKLVLLPRLTKQYFVMGITFSEKWFYKIIIGNDRK